MNCRQVTSLKWVYRDPATIMPIIAIGLVLLYTVYCVGSSKRKALCLVTALNALAMSRRRVAAVEQGQIPKLSEGEKIRQT
jgi:hypothetical protein